ncbi:MAG: hypothetical protein V3V05_08945 [Pontiella sp.]
MLNSLNHIAFIGPGGPELLVIMLVLLLMFGAKDAPRIFRKINEFLNQVRNTADGFKREVMYGDLKDSTTSSEHHTEYDSEHDHDYDYESDYNEAENYGDDYSEDEEKKRDYSNETFQGLEKDLEGELKPEESESDPATETEGEDDDVPKT